MESEQPAHQNPPSLLHTLPAQEGGQLHVSATSLKATRNVWTTLSGLGWDCWAVCAVPGVGLVIPVYLFQLKLFCDSTVDTEEDPDRTSTG